jgi:hypothetical protein
MPDQTSNSVDLAREILDDAISHFFKGNSFLYALRRARTAEELLSKALSHRGEQDSVDWQREALEPLHAFQYGRSLSREEFIEKENRALIAVTRMESVSEPSVTLDLDEPALWTIVRACDNWDRLGLPRTARMVEFENWFYEHVVGDMVGDVA